MPKPLLRVAVFVWAMPKDDLKRLAAVGCDVEELGRGLTRTPHAAFYCTKAVTDLRATAVNGVKSSNQTSRLLWPSHNDKMNQGGAVKTRAQPKASCKSVLQHTKLCLEMCSLPRHGDRRTLGNYVTVIQWPVDAKT